MNAREEKRAAFNEQMNEWVSRQGLWFQLRHAADGQTIVARLLRVGIRLSVILVVCCFLLWFYLVKRVESEGFRDGVASALQSTLAAESCEVGSIQKTRDTVSISSVKMEGGGNTFFHAMSARVIRLNMGITDGVVGKWTTETVNVDQLDLEVKAGESDDAAAAKSFSGLFPDHGSFEFGRIMVDQANIEWGYSSTNRGSISNSTMVVSREGGAWNIELKGGTFSQNWLKNLEIQRITAVCDSQGVHIKEAVLHSGLGTVSFQLDIGSGGKPAVSGTLQMTSMPFSSLLPTQYDEWLEGTISGKGTIGGSTNSQEGIVLDLGLELDEGDVMILRDRLPIFSALSVVDLYNSYRKVSFNEGGFRIRTADGRMKVSNLDVRAGSLLQFKGGGFTVRPPTDEEIASALNIEDVGTVTNVMQNRWEFEDDGLLNTGGEGGGVSAAARGVGEVTRTGETPGDRAEEVIAASILAEAKVRRFDGEVNIGLKHDAFDKAEKLRLKYPVDEATGRIWVKVPLDDRLQSLTLKQAQQFYILGKNRL